MQLLLIKLMYPGFHLAFHTLSLCSVNYVSGAVPLRFIYLILNQMFFFFIVFLELTEGV